MRQGERSIGVDVTELMRITGRDAMRESCETQLEGELPTSLYSPMAIAYAGSIGALRVTPSGLGFIKGLKPDVKP